MDPNEQEGDEKIMQAENLDYAAETLSYQGNDEDSAKVEETAEKLREEGIQQQIDTESQISEEQARERSQNSKQTQ